MPCPAGLASHAAGPYAVSQLHALLLFVSHCCRISITEIRSHPWFVKPLPPPYQEALSRMTDEQRKIHLQVRDQGLKGDSGRASSNRSSGPPPGRQGILQVQQQGLQNKL